MKQSESQLSVSRCGVCRILLRTAVALVALFLWNGPSRGQNTLSSVSEYEVKAAYLVNFARFVEWPAPSTPGSPFYICILGDDPFHEVLDRLAANERINGRLMIVRRFSRLQGDCHILFVSNSERDVFTILRLAPSGVLTVGDTAAFRGDGGMISFVIENRRVRFDVNLKAAIQGGVQISSRLLGVARVVDR
jgi:hypothetical protein